MHDGLLGLLLYLVHWLSPGTGDARIDVNFIKEQNNRTAIFQCRLDAAMNRQLEQIIDAGIPLQFKFVNVIGQADTLCFYRTLKFNMVEFTYFWTDSTSIKTTNSKTYTLIHLALVDFCKWILEIPENAQYCRIDIIILPSRAEQLDKVVDMSRIWGQHRVSLAFDPREKKIRKIHNEWKGH